jgi:hypothetical protein
MNDPMNESTELQEEQFEYDFENPPVAQAFNNVPQAYAPPTKARRCSCSMRQELRGVQSEMSGVQRKSRESQPVSSSGRWIIVEDKLILLNVVPGRRG